MYDLLRVRVLRPAQEHPLRVQQEHHPSQHRLHLEHLPGVAQELPPEPLTGQHQERLLGLVKLPQEHHPEVREFMPFILKIYQTKYICNMVII